MGTKSYLFRPDNVASDANPPQADQAEPLVIEGDVLPASSHKSAGSWTKGVSGNPEGRRAEKAKQTLDAFLEAKIPSDLVIERFAGLLFRDDVNPDVQLRAINIYFERIGGKPTQKLDVAFTEDDVRYQVAAARLALLTALISPAPDANAIDADYKELPEAT